MMPKWLPLAIEQEVTMTNEAFVKFVHDTVFVRDFITSRPIFSGITLSVKFNPERSGYCATYWHFISEGPNEDNRVIVPERCSKVPWIRPIIENSGDINVRIWSNYRKGNERILLWFNAHQKDNYLVVLEKRQETRGVVILPWTAYPVTPGHSARKLEKEYRAYLANCP